MSIHLQTWATWNEGFVHISTQIKHVFAILFFIQNHSIVRRLFIPLSNNVARSHPSDIIVAEMETHLDAFNNLMESVFTWEEYRTTRDVQVKGYRRQLCRFQQNHEQWIGAGAIRDGNRDPVMAKIIYPIRAQCDIGVHLVIKMYLTSETFRNVDLTVCDTQVFTLSWVLKHEAHYPGI